jgi:nitrite reductase (NADH) small subunit
MGERTGLELGKAEEFPLDRFRVVEVEGREVGILRRSDGSVRAVLNVCPHRRGPICIGRFGGSWIPTEPGTLEWGLEGRVLQCPWHGWEFDVETGESLFGTSKMRLLTYEAWEENGRIHVDLTPRRRMALAS